MNTAQEHPEELLPWYANQTLSGEELEYVQKHLQSCERCQREVELLGKMRTEYQEQFKVTPPGVFGLARLKREIKKDQEVGLKKPSPKPAMLWWRPAMAAAVLVIVVQSVLLFNMNQPEQLITPLSGPVTEAVTLQVRFKPQAPAAAIQELLHDIDGEIIGGPGSLGIYRIALKDVDADQQAAIDKTVNTLKKKNNIIEYVAQE